MVSLTKLRSQLAKEQRKIREFEEKKRLSRKLDMIKNPGKYKFQSIAKRTGRGVLVLGKKASKGISTYAQRLAEEQKIKSKKPKKKKRKGSNSYSSQIPPNKLSGL